jgi:hypothetical protein
MPWEICYSIEASQSLKARKFSPYRSLNNGCEGNEVLNS